jgi:hypothetical protein
MILNNTPTHEAVLSNVGEIGEFRIRNSAKAFSILSSGLYANKIRAIVRELSCNAVDSHVAAGKSTVPFDVHLPTNLEPWFAVRDYGVGLSHDQVTKIYTTYFESTKTGSNDFIGALGLGSKSPFSYTDNFTVAAVQNGVRGVYSAFINGDGVPSIALMTTETTDEPNGVEIKFSVNDKYDYSKFRDEACVVYRYFSLQPNTNVGLQVPIDEYETRDIIPGVHEYSRRHYNSSVAVMGNIAYPIAVPNSVTVLGSLSPLLECGLEMHFGIGELDFQASREGLSYVPQTIDAIRRKLEALNAALTAKLTEDVDKIENLWVRAKELERLNGRRLWAAAVEKYVTTTKFTLYTPRNGYGSYREIQLIKTNLANSFNVAIKAFQVNITNAAKVSVSMLNDNAAIRLNPDDNRSLAEWGYGMRIQTRANYIFAVNDTKKGGLERCKHHYRQNLKRGDGGETVFLLEPADRSKPMLTEAFFNDIMNPPRVVKVSTLDEKERKTMSRDVTIMRLERRDGGYRRNSDDLVWRDAGNSSIFDNNVLFYYLPLNGFMMTSKYKWSLSASDLGNYLKCFGVGALNTITVYGVRKADIETIKAKKNWVNLEDHIVDVLKKNQTGIVESVLSRSLDNYPFVKYNSSTTSILRYVVDKTAPYAMVVNKVKNLRRDFAIDQHSMNVLMTAYNSDMMELIEKGRKELRIECDACYKHYPLLEMLENSIDRTAFSSERFAEYINLIDSQKKNEQI